MAGPRTCAGDYTEETHSQGGRFTGGSGNFLPSLRRIPSGPGTAPDQDTPGYPGAPGDGGVGNGPAHVTQDLAGNDGAVRGVTERARRAVLFPGLSHDRKDTTAATMSYWLTVDSKTNYGGGTCSSPSRGDIVVRIVIALAALLAAAALALGVASTAHASTDTHYWGMSSTADTHFWG